jgi:hypothetical protein
MQSAVAAGSVDEVAQLVEAGPDFLRWSLPENPTGSESVEHLPVRTWVELATGLTYFDSARGVWVPTVEAFEIRADGWAVAARGPHRVAVAPDLRTWGGIQIESADGERLRSHLLGLAYYDPETRSSVLIAEPRESVGVLAFDNQVIWEDALDGLRAAVRVTYAKAGVEHDLVLLEAPPPPAAFGLPETSRLELWHELVDTPALTTRIENRRTNDPPASAELWLEDRALQVGSLRMARGRAFSLAPNALTAGLPVFEGAGVAVQKAVHSLDGRHFLVESVDYAAVRSELEELEAADWVDAAGRFRWGPGVRMNAGRCFPEGPLPTATTGAIQLARVNLPERAWVLDYALLNSTTNLTLCGDTTYHVSSLVNLAGVTTLEAAVIKFSAGAQLRIHGTLRCETGPYHPAVLTGYHDNTAGEALPGSTGDPWSSYAAATALHFEDNVSDLRHVRILHAHQGVWYDWDSGGPHRLSHVQFLHCQKAVVPHQTTVRVANVLMDGVETAFFNASHPATVDIEHLTAVNVGTFRGSGLLTINLTNSLLVNVTTVGTVHSAHCAINPQSPVVFEACGAGAFYLPVGSPYCNAGTPALSGPLRTELRSLTTEAPRILTGPISSPLTLTPEVWRDADQPDLGYHYPVVDYLVSNVVATATITLREGVVLGVTGGYGLGLNTGSGLISEGGVPHLNRLVHYRTVQEQPRSWTVNSILGWLCAPLPEVRLRLTEISGQPGGGGLNVLLSAQPFHRVSLVDCQLHRVRFYLCPGLAAGVNPEVGWTNNLLARCSVFLHRTGAALNTPFSARLFNNLFTGGSLVLSYDVSGVNPLWEVRDNLLDGVSQTVWGNGVPTYLVRSHNAFTIGTVNGLGGSSVYTGLSRGFESGPLGRYYYPAAGAPPSLGYLVGRGSRPTAGSVGLYHHTTQVSQQKELNSALDIGFHYLAVEPAEVEVAKGGMSLSASSSGSGWAPAKAADQLTTDPGWHNATFTGTTEYLRVDLGSSRTVSGVDYVPRVMSGNWVDGSHNGVLRQYAVHVTESASGDPAQWGLPVASGEWYWPNRQERRSLRFAARTGRYVILRRLTAWGWYSAQDPNYAAYNYPGFANANEIWVWEERALESTALDSDTDGLPDYVEDVNGDGIRDPWETDFTLADTDGDGLSDGAEVHVTGTDPTNPADGPQHDAVYVPYQIAHPLWRVAQGYGTEVITTQEKLLVGRGTDAIRLFIHVHTGEAPENYPEFNDRLTYQIQSPLVGIIVGTFRLTQLGGQGLAMIFPAEWFVCHAKTLEADSYVTFKLTSQNINSATGDSTILVGLSALRVDFDPIMNVVGENRFVFTSNQTGVLALELGATVQPAEQEAFDYLGSRVRFELEAIGDSELRWEDEDNPGVGIADGHGFHNNAEFHGLPSSNAAFGRKLARLYVDGLWDLDSEQEIKVFFPADAYNYPGCPERVADPNFDPEGTPDKYIPSNYFFYYSQIPSVVYGNPQFNYLGSGETKPWMTDPPYPYYVEARRERLGYPVHFGTNAGRTYQYINVFAYACRHEATHASNYATWWPQRHRAPNEPLDRDNDAMPNDVETANGYNPDHPVSFPPPPEILNWNDDQRYTLSTEPEWEPNEGDGLDWAHPGAQWP